MVMICSVSRMSWIVGVLAAFVGVGSWIVYGHVDKKFSSLVDALVSARYIENTRDTGSSCENADLGDLTCGGARFEAWRMSSAEKEKVCLEPTKPESKSIQEASGWFNLTLSESPSREELCQQTQKMNIYLFTVDNLGAFIKGDKLRVRELNPISVRKTVDKVEIDRKEWDDNGIAKYSETVKYELIDEGDLEERLNEYIIVPKLSLFGTLHQRAVTGERITVEQLLHIFTVAKVLGPTVINPETLQATAGALIPGIALFDLMIAVYRGGLQGVKLKMNDDMLTIGQILADSENCKQRAATSKETPLAFYCSKAYSDLINLAPLDSQHYGFTVLSALTFYEYEKGCSAKAAAGNPRASELRCTVKDICGAKSGVELEECLRPRLDEETTRNLLYWLGYVSQLPEPSNSDDSTLDAFGEISNFLQSCHLRAEVKLFSQSTQQVDQRIDESLCRMIHDQLTIAGRALMATSPEDNNEWETTLVNGKSQKDMASKSLGKRVQPYFTRTTVKQALGLKQTTLNPLTNTLETTRHEINPKNKPGQGFDYKLVEDKELPSATESTEQLAVIERFMSSKYKQLGLGSYKSYKGIDYVCEYDLNCVTQDQYIASKTCVPGKDNCNPPSVRGYDISRLPAHVLGKGENVGKGSVIELFVTDFAVRAKFKLEGVKKWRGVKANLWTLKTVEGGGATRCEDTEGRHYKDIDCDSPMGTVAVGSFASPKPHKVSLPLYLSSPFFIEQGDSRTLIGQQRTETNADLSTMVDILPCNRCKNRTHWDLASHLLTEPELGIVLQGVRRTQMNVRIKTPGEGSSVFPDNTDVLVPIFWVEQFDSAKEHQISSVKSFQSKVVFAQKLRSCLVVVGIVLCVVALLVFVGKLWMARKHQRGLLERQGTGDSSDGFRTQLETAENLRV